MKLTQAFYHRDTRLVAQALLGKYLVRFQDGLPLVVRIQETEAYIGRMDKACHAYNYRRTPRTETLFAPPGTAYIYLIYGMYHCLNFVTEPEGEPCAVLIRGGQPRGSLSFLARTFFSGNVHNLYQFFIFVRLTDKMINRFIQTCYRLFYFVTALSYRQRSCFYLQI